VETENSDSNAGSNSKSLLIGIATALSALAVFVVLSSNKTEELAGTPNSKAKSGSEMPKAPPTDNRVTPKEEVLPPGPPTFHIFAKVWSKKCKGKACGDSVRIAGKVSVRDRFGEIASYAATKDGSVKISNLPAGDYNLVAIDENGKESTAKAIKIPETGSGTISADLTILKK